MDVALDLYLAVPLLLTVLAVIVASLFVKLRSAEGDKVAETGQGGESQGEEAGASPAADRLEGGEGREDGEGEGTEGEALQGEGIKKGEEAEEEAEVEGRRIPVVETGAGEKKTKRAEENEELPPEETAGPVGAEKQSHPSGVSIPRPAAEAEEEEEEEESKEEDQDWENERLVVQEPDVDHDEQISFKYSPGKLRGNQYKTMMTKEELEEEQRTEDYMKLSLASS